MKILVGTKEWRDSVIFIILGLIFFYALQQILLVGMRLSDEGNVGIFNRVLDRKIKADVLISGSSRARYHFDPRIIEAETNLKTYNIGRDGTKLHEQLELFQLYLSRNSPPQFLIQSLDIWSLTKNEDITDPKQYISWLNDDEIYNSLVERKPYYLLYRWCPLLGLVRTGGTMVAVRGLLQSGIDKPDSFKGYFPQYLVWNKDFDRFKAKNPNGINLVPDPQKIKSLIALLELGKKNGVKIILIFSPEYRETQEIFLHRNDVFKIFKQIANKYQVQFWDYSQDPMCSNKAYFYNSQHVNNLGAAVFTESIAKRLKIEIAKGVFSFLIN